MSESIIIAQTPQEIAPKPRCLHGEIWNACETCRHCAWCEDCGALVDDLDEPLHPSETITCAACVDRMIAPRVLDSGQGRP